MSSLDQAGGATTAPTQTALGDPTLYPCSKEQHRFYFLQALSPGSAMLNITWIRRLTGPVRAESLRAALQLLTERHEALRTAMTAVDGEPQQKVYDRVAVALPQVDLSRLPEAERLKTAREIAEREALTPFDIEQAPLMRAQLVRLDERDAHLIFSFHNAVIDAWSFHLMMREFGLIVEALEEGRAPDLPEPPIQYVDYALWQAELMKSEAFQADRAYWAEQLKDLPRFELLTDKPRPPVRTASSVIRSRLMTPAIDARLGAFTKAAGRSAFQVSAAALTAALSRRAGQTDVVIGSQFAGRNEVELEGLVGPLTNMMMLRFDASGDPTFETLLERAGETMQGALTHQRMPFDSLVEMLKPKRDPSRTPIYSVMLAAQKVDLASGSAANQRFGGLTVEPIPSPPTGARTDLSFFMIEREEGWRLSCEANSDLFEDATVEALLDDWERALEMLMAEPEARLSAFAPGLAAAPTPAAADAAPAVSPTAPPVAAATPRAEAPAHAPDGAPLQPIAEIWSELLGAPAGPDTDFFDAGGHSLIALRMAARVSKALGREAPVALVFAFPRLADYVAAASGAAPAARGETTPHVTFRIDGRRPPVIALNYRLAYRPFARALDKDRGFVDLRVGDEADYAHLKEHGLEATIERVVERIRAAQPQGPYALVGYCGYGAVSFLAARRLQALGETVTLVGAMDSAAPRYFRALSRPARIYRLLRKPGMVLKNTLYLLNALWRGEISLATFLRRYGFIERLGIVDGLLRLGVIKEDTADHGAEGDNSISFLDAVLAEWYALDLEPAPVNLMVFRSEGLLKTGLFPPLLNWNETTSGRLEAVDVAMPHDLMTHEPGASDMARAYRRLLREIEEDAAPG